MVKELAKRPGVIKERAHLMDIAYKENTEIEDRTIDSHVKNSKKFKRVDEKFSAIETNYRSGYRWNVSWWKRKKHPQYWKFLLAQRYNSILGLFTILYLNAIQPNLVKKVSASHFIIINNTSDHIERLGVEFNKEGIKQFLLSTRFLFQGLDRVQFLSEKGDLIGDTNILDLDTSVFEKSDEIIEEGVEKKQTKKKSTGNKSSEESSLKKIVQNRYKNQPITIQNK